MVSVTNPRIQSYSRCGALVILAFVVLRGVASTGWWTRVPSGLAFVVVVGRDVVPSQVEGVRNRCSIANLIDQVMWRDVSFPASRNNAATTQLSASTLVAEECCESFLRRSFLYVLVLRLSQRKGQHAIG